MIRSMTGYGKAILDEDSREYQVEIKSVNHRYLDISIKMPRELSYMEEEIKREISKKVRRGKVDVTVSFKNYGAEGISIEINKELAKAYIKEFRKLAEEENLQDDIEVTEVTKLPDVLIVKENEDDQKIKQELIECVANATDNLAKMKEKEGEKLAQDLLVRINEIKEKIKKYLGLSTGLIEEYVVKLEKRIKELLKTEDVDKSRIAQEVVIYADKCSIEEEVTRLNSHILQFEELLNSNGSVGKKLDFIIQEMNRETNTIGSKANSLEITNEVINIKTELENIREQTQNIE